MNARSARSNPAPEKLRGRFPKRDILSVPVAAVTVAEFSSWLIAALQSRDDEAPPLFVTYLNAACSNISADDPQYLEILNEADCVYADGQAVVWAAGYLGEPLPERVNAGDFITDFCGQLSARDLKIGLLGGRPGVADKAARKWKEAAPGLNVVCAVDGFFEDGGAAAAAAVRESGADLLLIGMGVPLQEKWAWAHRHKVGVKAIWCVGALFEYYGEERARAPWWMRRAGLEWVFRLALEPRRLWRRYLVGNFRFVYRVYKAKH